MKAFFEPKSIAVVGATRNPAKPPYYLLQNLLELGYEGQIYPINPYNNEILGIKAFPHLRQLPEPADLAMILLPRESVPEAVSACGERGMRAVVIGSGGFGEKDETGKRLMDETLLRARAHGVRIMGPNSIGITNARLRFTTAFIDAAMPNAGPVSLVTQTGAVGGPLLHWLTGISKTACLGNRSDIDADEVVAYYARDPYTKVVGVHSEGFNNPTGFVEAIKKCSRRSKPLVLFKAGNTRQGVRIATSHTGRMGSEAKMLLVAARQAGAILVEDFEVFFDTLKMLAVCDHTVTGIGIVSISGASLVMAGDVCARLNLPIAEAEAQNDCLSGKALYDIGSWSGEMDVTELYARSVRLAMNEPGVSHCLVYMIPTPRLFRFDAAAVLGPIKEAFPHKGLIAAVAGEETLCAQWSKSLEAKGVPCYSAIERGLKALSRQRDWALKNGFAPKG